MKFQLQKKQFVHTYYEVQLIILSRYVARNEPSVDRMDTLIL